MLKINNKMIIFISLAVLFSSVTFIFTNASARKKIELTKVGEIYGSTRKDPRWDPKVDINHDGVINIKDLALASKDDINKNVRLSKKTLDVYIMQAGSPIISVNPENTLVDQLGKNFSIDVNVTDALETYAWEFNLSWDPSLIKIVEPNVTEGGFLNQDGTLNTSFAYFFNQTEGWMIVGCTLYEQPEPLPSGSGTLATLHFTTLNEGYSPLNFSDTYLLNDTLDNYIHEKSDGNVFVDQTPPVVTILSPENGKTYSSSSVALIFTVNEQTSWTGYNLDSLGNVTSGNTTLFGLAEGPHNVIVYARDIVGNEGSDSVGFTVEPCKANGESCTSGAQCCSHACWFGTCSSGYNGGGGGGGGAASTST